MLTHKDLTFILLILIGMTLPTISAYWIFGSAKLTSDNILQFVLFISISIPFSYTIGSIAVQMHQSQSQSSQFTSGS